MVYDPHRYSKSQIWHIGKFKYKEITDLLSPYDKGTEEYGSRCMKLIEDCYFNPKKTIAPIQMVRKSNVLLLVGLEESAKRDTAQTTTTVTHIQLGTSGTAEVESQTGLLAAIGNRLEYDVAGSRSVGAGTQVAKYSMVFADTDGFTPPVTLREAGQVNLLTGGIFHSRVQFPDFVLNTGEAVLTQINETHVNG